MQKGILILFLGLLVFGIAVNSPILIADDDNNSNNNSGSGSNGDNDSNDEDDEDDDDRNKARLKFEIRRTIVNEDGSISKIRIKIEEIIEDGVIKRKIKVTDDTRGGEFEAKTKLELKEVLINGEKSIFAILSNGDEALINITPDRIAEIARERLESRNLTLELKEIKHKNVPKVVYQVETNKNGKFLGIFKIKLKIKAQIDPETGEFIGGIIRPWWAFLITGEESDETGEEPPENETDENLITVELTAENDSNESGMATLVEENEQVTVNISMTGAPENVSQPVHIHLGSCPEVDGIQYPLTNILDGESITIINATLDQLESELPLAINVHKSVDEASVYVSCGNIIFN